MNTKITSIHTTLPDTPGERIKLLRDELHMTQQKVASSIHCHVKHYSSMENNHRKITRENAHALSLLFGVDEAFIMCESDCRTISERVSQAQNEGDLLYLGLWSFAELTGYKVTPPDLRNENGIEAIVESIKTGYQIEHSGKVINLSLEEMNHFENMLCDMAESAFKYLFKERGVE